ncbi:MAG: F0F1 ATP synthase subunit delta [Betaproteobacteria bacterium]|nr:F0F1 ATP synthase subunit delta [Betaproteobacteria bacterium]
MQLDWGTFGLEIVNFLVLVWILKRFLYRPVLDTIARRKAAIEQTLADANAKQAGAQALEHEYQHRLAEWQKEKEALRAQAKEEVNAERARRMATLQGALDQEREKRSALEQQQMNEWRKRVADEALAQGAQFATRLLSRLATPELEARLVPLALDDLAHLPDMQLQAIRTACRDAANKIRVATAFPLPETQRRALLQRLAEAAKANLSAEFAEDPSLLAGLRVSIGPWIMRANLHDELKFFAEAPRDGT